METKDKTAVMRQTETAIQATPQTTLQLAIERGMDPATIGKLMDLQERYEAGQARKAFVEAMAGFKAECPAVIGKDRNADFGPGKAKYSYASTGAIVEAITPALSKYGLSLSWESKQEPRLVTVTCHITHSAGHRESATLTGPHDESGGKNPIQMLGSSVHYLQRYTLVSVLGLATADMDDPDARQKQRAPIAPPRARTPTTTPTPPPATPATPPATGDTASNTLTGVVEQVSEKETKTKKMKYGVKLANDPRWFGTFSASMGKDAQYYRTEGIEVVLTIEESGNFWNLTSIEPAHTANAAPTSPEAEELPFE